MMSSQFYVFSALVYRNIYVMKSRILSMILNGCILGILQAILYGYFMPQMGMPSDRIAPMYMGTIMQIFLFIGSDKVFKTAYDFDSLRFIDYQLSLPISHSWFFASNILSYIIELTVQGFFPTVAGALLIRSVIDLSYMSIPWLIAIHLLSVLTSSLLFLTITYAFDFTWHVDNAWPRFFIPLMLLGAVYYPWEKIYVFSHYLGFLFLLNPFTYIIEGFRGALLGELHTIPLWFCTIALLMFSIVFAYTLKLAVKKNLDPI